MGKRLVRHQTNEELRKLNVAVGCVESHFLDSGSFTLWRKNDALMEEDPKRDPWAFYDSDEFWQYVDDYCAFVKKYKIAIDLYANVDVIPNPKLTWRDQRYIEKNYGLKPVPVVHYKTDLKWLRHYIDKGYEMICLGGLVGSTSQDACRAWIDRCFEMVCDNPSRLPCVKLHGFGVTSFELMFRYPWYSVDSTSWTKVGAYGGILVPHRRGGKFIFTEQPYLMKMSDESPETVMFDRHYLTMSKAEQAVVEEWLDLIKVPLGKRGPRKPDGSLGEIIELGVVTGHADRRAANLHFFELMRDAIPKYPWPFRSTRRQGFFF